MDKKDKVSIIVTVRNEEKNIPILLEAFLRQTYKFEEIVINDNGSTDNTVGIIKDYQKKYTCIKLVESSGKSIGEGRNTAIKNSCGDILAIIDAGICPDKDWLEKVVTPMQEDTKIDVVWGHVIFDTKSRVFPSTDLSIALVFLTKYPEDLENVKKIPSSSFRRRVWEDMGGFPEIQLPIEDLLLIDAIVKRGFKSIYVNDANVYYFRYPDSYYDIFRKWSVSAYCSFMVRKSEKGFYRQFFIFGLFFTFVVLSFVDFRMTSLIFLYMFVFLANKMMLNMEVGRRVLSNPKLFIKVLNLFFILNLARLSGVIKAIMMIVTGKAKKLKIIEY